MALEHTPEGKGQIQLLVLKALKARAHLRLSSGQSHNPKTMWEQRGVRKLPRKFISVVP